MWKISSNRAKSSLLVLFYVLLLTPKNNTVHAAADEEEARVRQIKGARKNAPDRRLRKSLMKQHTAGDEGKVEDDDSESFVPSDFSDWGLPGHAWQMVGGNWAETEESISIQELLFSKGLWAVPSSSNHRTSRGARNHEGERADDASRTKETKRKLMRKTQHRILRRQGEIFQNGFNRKKYSNTIGRDSSEDSDTTKGARPSFSGVDQLLMPIGSGFSRPFRGDQQGQDSDESPIRDQQASNVNEPETETDPDPANSNPGRPLQVNQGVLEEEYEETTNQQAANPNELETIGSGPGRPLQVNQDVFEEAFDEPKPSGGFSRPMKFKGEAKDQEVADNSDSQASFGSGIGRPLPVDNSQNTDPKREQEGDEEDQLLQEEEEEEGKEETVDDIKKKVEKELETAAENLQPGLKGQFKGLAKGQASDFNADNYRDFFQDINAPDKKEGNKGKNDMKDDKGTDKDNAILNMDDAALETEAAGKKAKAASPEQGKEPTKEENDGDENIDSDQGTEEIQDTQENVADSSSLPEATEDSTACQLCPNGGPPTKMNRTFMHTTTTCQDLEDQLPTSSSPSDCMQLKKEIPVPIDVEAYCGCEGSSTSFVSRCTFCPEGTTNLYHGVTIPALNGWSCGQVEDYVYYISNEASCKSMDHLASLCCGTYDQYWHKSTTNTASEAGEEGGSR